MEQTFIIRIKDVEPSIATKELRVYLETSLNLEDEPERLEVFEVK